MSEIVERVAKAIADYWLANGFDPSEPSYGAARAAISAMRKPCLSGRCYSPLACSGFGYCRERNFAGDSTVPSQNYPTPNHGE